MLTPHDDQNLENGTVRVLIVDAAWFSDAF